MQTAMENGKISMQEGLGIAATAVTAMSGIFAAQAKAKVAGVDKEIAAEKKRDGKSKASLAKIAQLEKKKDAIKKKAFEKEIPSITMECLWKENNNKRSPTRTKDCKGNGRQFGND